MPTPTPGRPVRGSATGRPIMAALDLLGRRWVLRILWELRDGPLGFRALQKACDGMSSSVLASRLADLTSTGIVITDDRGDYALSEVGQDLRQAMRPLLDWSRDWAASQENPSSEQEGRGAAWGEERRWRRATKERATREGGASRAPRRRAGNTER
jgi:DNA-binding HxlR family transcriptional regulator